MEIKIAMGHFWIKFENGSSISVFNGFGSHTENHFDIEKQNKIIENRDIMASWTSETVEIAIINKKGEFITDKILKDVNDNVATITIKELLTVINVLNILK